MIKNIKRQEDETCGILSCKFCSSYYECYGYNFKSHKKYLSLNPILMCKNTLN